MLLKELSSDAVSQISLEQIDKQVEMIALEASFSIPSFSSLLRYIPGFSLFFSNKEKELDNNIAENQHILSQLSYLQSKVYKATLSLNFAEFSETVISVPENFDGDLKEYLVYLNKTAPEIFNLSQTTIGTYNTLLATYTTNPTTLSNLNDYTRLYKEVQVKREKVIKELNYFFPKITGRSKRQLSDVCKSPNDLRDIISNYKKEPTLNKQLKLLSAEVKKASNYLNMLHDVLRFKDNKDISSSTANNLANGAQEIGKLIELNSMLCFNNSVLGNCVKSLMERIKAHRN